MFEAALLITRFRECYYGTFCLNTEIISFRKIRAINSLYDVLFCRNFCPWDVLSLEDKSLGRFVVRGLVRGTFCRWMISPWDVLSLVD